MVLECGHDPGKGYKGIVRGLGNLYGGGEECRMASLGGNDGQGVPVEPCSNSRLGNGIWSFVECGLLRAGIGGGALAARILSIEGSNSLSLCLGPAPAIVGGVLE